MLQASSLINHVDADGMGLIHLVSALGYEWAVELLLASGASESLKVNFLQHEVDLIFILAFDCAWHWTHTLRCSAALVGSVGANAASLGGC